MKIYNLGDHNLQNLKSHLLDFAPKNSFKFVFRKFWTITTDYSAFQCNWYYFGKLSHGFGCTYKKIINQNFMLKDQCLRVIIRVFP